MGSSIRHYLADAWNGAPNGAQPTALHGVADRGEVDADGFKVYEISDE